jgi:hypothetical protein
MLDDSSPTLSVERLARWAIWILGAAALAYLMVEHRPHLFGWLPYLIILACPLMHFFMHRKHHRSRGSSSPTGKNPAEHRS